MLPKLTQIRFNDFSFKEFYLNSNRTFFIDLKNRNKELQLKTFDRAFIEKNKFVFSFGQMSSLNESAEFCDYKDYPHDKCVISVQNQKIECSNCLNLFIYLLSIGIVKEFKHSCLINSELIETLLGCNFDQRVKDCHRKEEYSPKFNYANYINELDKQLLNRSINRFECSSGIYFMFLFCVIFCFLFNKFY